MEKKDSAMKKSESGRTQNGDEVTATIQIADGPPMAFNTEEDRDRVEEQMSEWMQKFVDGALPDFEKAMKAPHPATWPDGEKYVRAGIPGALADLLIPKYHPHLTNARISYLWKQELQIRGAGRVRLAKASKCDAKLAFLANSDFVILFNWKAWEKLTAMQRVAIADHELCHCDQDLDSGAWKMRHHDVEEFSEIVGRYGLWKMDLMLFGHQLKQLELDLSGASS